MKKSFVIAAVVCALGGTASAQDDVEGGTDATEETTTETTETTAEPAAATGDPAESGAAGGHQYGIEASLNSAADEGAVHLLYNLGGNYLDVGLGLAFVSAADTEWNLELELGYRMMRPLVGRVQPYIKPLVVLTVESAPPAPGADSETELGFGVGAAFGVDYELFPQFTLGTEVGAALLYQDTDPDATISVALVTAALKATFWW
jgi:hypothetical protein